MNLFKPLPPWRCCRRLQARPRSQKHCEGKHVTTTFRQEVSEPELPTNLGASTTILRTRSIVLMSIEANVDCMRGLLGHRISGLRHGGSLVQKPPLMIGD
jgi:hypothetical protein